MKVLVTGAKGFIGKNLVFRLRETEGIDVIEVDRDNWNATVPKEVAKADVIVHLAGENRPISEDLFDSGNVETTQELCNAIVATGKKIPVIFASSAQSILDNVYGRSKLAAEKILESFAQNNESPVCIYRLPGVFGKWCRPNYNSVVATFCHNVVNGIPIEIHDNDKELSLAYIDDVVTSFFTSFKMNHVGCSYMDVNPVYSLSIGKLASTIQSFFDLRTTLHIEGVGDGLMRALYATYISHLPPKAFSYALAAHTDERGSFVEVLKTRENGQVSFFTAKKGVTRGGHYHHTKTEKFVVVQGRALFRFRHIVTGERYELVTSSDQPEVVDTVPGWSHDITNIGDDEMIVMLWANEVYDPTAPDTIIDKL
jgi:UDP-2-acetamido-2,6-beta-L-arabino-hexul-4-ose reductase